MSPPPGRVVTLGAGSDGRISFALGLAALGLYATTLCRTVYFYDSAELAAAAATLGIPHPPGYPLYTLVGHLYVRLLPGEPALAVNVMSAVHGALCVGLSFLLARRLGAGRAPALLAAALFATGPTFWWNCNVAEVYTTGLVFVLATFLLLFAGLETKRPRLLLWAAFVAGLGFAAHMFIATLGLGYAWLVWCGSACAGQPRDALAAAPRSLRLRFMGKAALATLAGASLYLYLPLRARMQPALNYGGVDRLDRFAWMVSGGEYKRWFLRDYDFLERLGLVASRISEQLTLAGTLLGLVGLALLCARRRDLGVALALSIAGNVFFFFGYRVHDVEVFFLPTVALLAVCAGVALTAVLARLDQGTVLRRLAVALVASLLGLQATRIRETVDLSRDDSARSYGEHLLRLLPRNAVLLDFATPEEWRGKAVFEHYFQGVLGARPDVTTRSAKTWPALRSVFTSARPVFMYAHVAHLDRYLIAAPSGPLFRVRLSDAAVP